MYKNGEPDQSACKENAGKIANAIRASCPACKVIESCVRGLDSKRRNILSRDPLAVASARLPNGTLTMTISAADTPLALSLCRQTELQTASKAADLRLRCFPALSPR